MRVPEDAFEHELVCIHVFTPEASIPGPLLKSYRRVPGRPKGGRLFRAGIPELLVGTTTESFLHAFQYFWPVSRAEFTGFWRQVSVRFAKEEVGEKGDIDDLARYLGAEGDDLRAASGTSAVVLTLNGYTKYWSSDLVALWRDSGIEEFVVLKDPRRPPYLCDYPAPQRGFKRPPP
jgi:hypothetical protein